MGRHFFILLGLLFGLTLWQPAATAVEANTGAQKAYMPIIRNDKTELRGLWVSRFDWTSSTSAADPAKIDEIVHNAAAAGFNAIFFQVRGTADAFYTPGLEPWSSRVSGGELGQPPNPYWDPLAYFSQKAHENGLQLHAYLNVYPVWTGTGTGCQPPSATTSPLHLYHKLGENHLTWDSNGVSCGTYIRNTPASFAFDDHFIAVVKDLVTRYELDGIHLDHIRYGSSATSCDPVSEAYAGGECFATTPSGYVDWADWQRAQINGLVYKLYTQVVPMQPGLMLSAAVWPIHTDKWGWGGRQGFYDYYQDSKAWIGGGYIDAIMPMIYSSSYKSCTPDGRYPDESEFWSRAKWQTLTTDFMAGANGRFIIPGIGSGYCSFDEIAARIQIARDLGAPGHALFSYGALLENSYFDDLAAGPYAQPAIPPPITWHP